MAGQRLSMRKTREILRQKWVLGRSHREVAQSLGVSVGMVSDSGGRWESASGRRGGQRLTLRGHSKRVIACAVAPDCSFVISASEDGTLKIWDPASGRERVTLAGHTAPIRGCAVSPDGTFVVSASEDRTLKLWNPSSGHERATLVGHTGNVTGCAVSPDAAYAVSASWDGTLRIWDAARAREVACYYGLRELRTVALHASLPLLVSGAESGQVSSLEIVGISYGPIICRFSRG